MLDMLSLEPQSMSARIQALRQQVWNALIPACAVTAEVMPYGVRYLHPTKGWKVVGKKRFAIRGVL